MSKTELLGIRVSEQTKQALEQLASEYDCTASQLAREKIHEMLTEEREALPAHTRIRFRREQIKNESAPDKYRGYFRHNMMNQARKAYDRGASAGEGTVLLKSFLEEHEMIFDEYESAGFIDPDLIREWATGLIAVYRFLSRSDKHGKEYLDRYQQEYPAHRSVFNELSSVNDGPGANRAPELETDLIDGWSPGKPIAPPEDHFGYDTAGVTALETTTDGVE
jgi:predicted DNA-binding protein